MLQKETRQPRGLKPLGARDRPVASTARPPRGDRTAMSPSRFFVGSPPSSSSELNSLRSFVLAANASAAARFGSGKGAARSRRDRARPVSAGNSASRLTAWFDASERSAELGPCNASASGVVQRADAEDMLEMTATDDQQPVEALAAHAADPALGVRSRPRRPHRRLLLLLRATPENDQLEQAPKRPIQQRNRNALKPTLWGAQTRFPPANVLIRRNGPSLRTPQAAARGGAGETAADGWARTRSG